jgi:hypothetical protein
MQNTNASLMQQDELCHLAKNVLRAKLDTSAEVSESAIGRIVAEGDAYKAQTDPDVIQSLLHHCIDTFKFIHTARRAANDALKLAELTSAVIQDAEPTAATASAGHLRDVLQAENRFCCRAYVPGALSQRFCRLL